jgi:hypothetical protein
VNVAVTGYGLPRGGNEAWASFLDSKARLVLSSYFPFSLSSSHAQLGLTFVTNQHDPVPIVPPKALGFQHSSGEIHSVDGTQSNFVACPGQDNENCSTGNSLIDFNIVNHLGMFPVLVSSPFFRPSPAVILVFSQQQH